MKIAAIIQARWASSRMPGKVLYELPFESGITVLAQVIRRLKKSVRLDGIIVATTNEEGADDIVKVAEEEGVKTFRGSESDVLSRYFHAAKETGAEQIVRITSDCPCVDAEIVDLIIERHLAGDVDYSSNTIERTYPHGLDVEVFSFSALTQAFNEAKEGFEREHVTPYIYGSGKFKLQNILAPKALRAAEIRITLDTSADYALLSALFDLLYVENNFFSAKDILDLFEKKPWLKLLNETITQKKIPGTLDEELKEAIEILEMQDLRRASVFIKERLAD